MMTVAPLLAAAARLGERRSVPVLAMLALAGCAQTPPGQPAPVPASAVQGRVITTSCGKPVYPAQALERKIEGTSTIRFLLSPEGKVLESRLESSSGDASLDEAARSALSQCTFTPPLYNGKPVRAWTAVRYVWKAD
jgi:TonB family protein